MFDGVHRFPTYNTAVLEPHHASRYLQGVTTLRGDLALHPLGGKELTLADQLTLFHLVAVVLDPYTYESSWLLDTAKRILSSFQEADCRPAFIVASDEEGTRSFLGPLADEFITFCDADREFIKELGVKELPAFVVLDLNCTVSGLAEGWNPELWRPIAEDLADIMSWSRPYIPAAGDPVPYAGSPALG